MRDDGGRRSFGFTEAGEGTPIALRAGEVLIHEGEASASVFVLLAGSLYVSRRSNGQTVPVATIDVPGSVVGEMVALGGGSRTATVTAHVDSRLLAFSAEKFRAALSARPDLASELAALAVRRAEEADLAEILARLGIDDEATLISACAAAEWHRLTRGEVLFSEGDVSDAIYFVVRGRLGASRYDAIEQAPIRLGEVGRGELVGDLGLLGSTRRAATVVALRDTVVASLDESAFLELIESQPRMMIEIGLTAVARAAINSERSSPNTVLAVVTCDRLPASRLLEALAAELNHFGTTTVLSPDDVDRALDLPGAANVGRGEVGDVRMWRLLHEAEMESDHLVLDLGQVPGPWSARCLAMVDRLLILVPADLTAAEARHFAAFFVDCPAGVHRTVVVVHPDADRPPTGTAGYLERFGAEDALHVVEGAAGDAARLARVAVGRGYALVLGGGGGRGFAHLGVLRALTELGIPVDIVGGTSIGGILAAVIADGFTADEAIGWAGRHFPRALDYTIPVVSLIKGARITRSAAETFGDRHIEDLWKTYFSVSANLTASRPYVHQRGELARTIRATSAIPGVMPPVPYDEALLIDGGVLNNLPIDVARRFTPAGKVIAVDVAPPRGPGARHDYGLAVSGWAALRSNVISKSRGYPRISAVLLRSMITASMRERDGQVAARLADLYLDLDMRGVSMLDFSDPRSVADRGYEAAMPSLQAWWATQSVSVV